jgi:hypothetical protein
MFLGSRPLPLAGRVVLRTGKLQTVFARWRLCHSVHVQLSQTTVTAATIHIPGTTFPECVAGTHHGRASSSVAGAVEMAA